MTFVLGCPMSSLSSVSRLTCVRVRCVGNIKQYGIGIITRTQLTLRQNGIPFGFCVANCRCTLSSRLMHAPPLVVLLVARSNAGSLPPRRSTISDSSLDLKVCTSLRVSFHFDARRGINSGFVGSSGRLTLRHMTRADGGGRRESGPCLIVVFVVFP